MEIVQFSKIAPYLINPLVLVGFCLFLLFGMQRMLLKIGLLTRLTQQQSSAIVRLTLKYGFRVAIYLTILGFAYAGFQTYSDATGGHSLQGPTIQQTGTCGSNIAGDNNKATIDCVAKASKTK